MDEAGLVGAMRTLKDKDAGWLGVQLEVGRRLRTDPDFRELWQRHLRHIARASQARLARQRDAGVVRDDIPITTLATFLSLVYDGLVTQLATGMSVGSLDGVLALVEQAVRETPSTIDQQDITSPIPMTSVTKLRSKR